MPPRTGPLLLAGGGHAHLAVLAALARGERPRAEVSLVVPDPLQIYSGMVPGWMTGHYTLDECTIDLRELARRAGVRLMLDAVTGIDANRRRIELAGGDALDYALLSLDLGSQTAGLGALGSSDRPLLPIRPLREFVVHWRQLLARAVATPRFHLVVVGAGAAGVEVAFAAHHAFAARAHGASVTLVGSAAGLLPGHAPAVARRVETLLGEHRIRCVRAAATGASGGLLLETGERLAADAIVATTGAAPPAWLRGSGLALGAAGFVAVGADHASVSHPEVFAAGDVCERDDVLLPRAGVHAVRAGPVLAHNLLARLAGKPTLRYTPRARSLYLLATGPRHAVLSWGSLCVAGRAPWYWKDRIDRRYVRRHGSRAPGTLERTP
ncbi:MAG: hypothetical protein CALGDGBN_00791 [Pseudomonadales bacterium]|nr:hypothetical protein [Pseudomonadales bacterium]